MPSFKIIGLLVLEKKIFKGFYHIWAWRPSWSCDLYHLPKLSFPLPKEDSHEIWHLLAERFQRRCLKIMVIYMRADLTKGSLGHFSSFYVIIILKTSKISIFCMFLQESQIASNM